MAYVLFHENKSGFDYDIFSDTIEKILRHKLTKMTEKEELYFRRIYRFLNSNKRK